MHRRLEEYRTKCDEDDKEKCSFIKLCLNFDPLLRPDAKTLSRHTSLFTLSQLRILAAHAVHEYRDIYPREGKLSLDTMLKNIKKDDEKGDNEHKVTSLDKHKFDLIILACMLHCKGRKTGVIILQ